MHVKRERAQKLIIMRATSFEVVRMWCMLYQSLIWCARVTPPFSSIQTLFTTQFARYFQRSLGYYYATTFAENLRISQCTAYKTSQALLIYTNITSSFYSVLLKTQQWVQLKPIIEVQNSLI